MQAEHRCAISLSPEGTASFTIVPSSNKQEPDLGQDESKSKEPLAKNDPIRMFGILTPPALRLTQQDALQIIEKMVPALLSVDMQMRDLEIKVRRARKFRAKALAKGDGVGGEVGDAVSV